MLTDERPGLVHQVDVLSLLDQLQEFIETAPRFPLSDRVVLSSELLLDLVDAIRSTLPQDLIEAERILQERHRLLDDARQQAGSTLETAREQVEGMLETAREQSRFVVQEHNVVKAAELRADRIITQAQRRADEIVESAEAYAQQLFSRFEEEAVRLAAEIRKAAALRS